MLAARYQATGRTKEMSEAVHTAITLALVSGILMAVVGVLLSRGALELMATTGERDRTVGALYENLFLRHAVLYAL